LNDSFPKSSTAALGRQHSATNGCFREVKNQRPLFGDELEEMSVAFRPNPDLEQAQLDGGHISLSSDSTYGFKNL
jgi:hypothetical protein